MFLNSAVSSPLDRSKRFTLFLPWQTCSFRHQLGFSWKHSSQAAITRQWLLTHISITVYSQVLIYKAESNGASMETMKYPNFETVAKGDSNPGFLDCEPGILPLSYRAPYKLYPHTISTFNTRASRLLYLSSTPTLWDQFEGLYSRSELKKIQDMISCRDQTAKCMKWESVDSTDMECIGQFLKYS